MWDRLHVAKVCRDNGFSLKQMRSRSQSVERASGADQVFVQLRKQGWSND